MQTHNASLARIIRSIALLATWVLVSNFALATQTHASVAGFAGALLLAMAHTAIKRRRWVAGPLYLSGITAKQRSALPPVTLEPWYRPDIHALWPHLQRSEPRNS